ncbi:MAG: DUF4339 domain-containing protein [Lentisphaeria bacterium]|nr:GYF domain-containing protein [Lentisphaeria bacterium]NQZ66624.1 DUF4339 domain-containing protein [Lentisphaeria bacterium]
MDWYYAKDNEQLGPVAEDVLVGLYNDGIINDESLIWNEEMSDWAAYGKVMVDTTEHSIKQSPPPEEAPDPSIALGADTTLFKCAICKESFPQSEIIETDNKYICAGCKPTLVQSIREGVSLDDELIDLGRLHTLCSQKSRLPAVRCVTMSWEILKNNFQDVLVGTLISMGIMMGIGFIPYLGPCIQIFIQGPLYGGYEFYLYKVIKGQPTTPNDVFVGFQQYGPLTVAHLATIFIPFIVLAIPLGLLVFLGMYLVAENTIPELVFFIFVGLLYIVFLAVFLVLMVVMFFVPLFILHQKQSIMDSIHLSFKIAFHNMWKMIWLYIIFIPIWLLGCLACGVGMLAVIPMYLISIIFIYDSILHPEEYSEF